MSRFSRTRSESKTSSSWGTYPIPSRASRSRRKPVMSRPSRATLPPSTRAIPSIAFSSVLLPAPLGPTTATTWPRDTSRSTSLTTGTSLYPALRPRVQSARSSAGASAEDIGVLDLLTQPQVRHPPLREHSALRHHDDLPADPVDGVQLVLDEDQRASFPSQPQAGVFELASEPPAEPGPRP